MLEFLQTPSDLLPQLPVPLYLQFTVFGGQGSQVRVAGLVQELGKEGPRELLGCERVLEEPRAVRLVPVLRILPLSLTPCPGFLPLLPPAGASQP